MTMLGSFKKSSQHLLAIAEIKALTRERFSLDQDTPILVTEVECNSPGCPPLETVVVFWTNGTTRHHFKIFKPADQIIGEDLPYSWQKNTLIVPEGIGCDCC